MQKEFFHLSKNYCVILYSSRAVPRSPAVQILAQVAFLTMSLVVGYEYAFDQASAFLINHHGHRSLHKLCQLCETQPDRFIFCRQFRILAINGPLCDKIQSG